MNNHSDASLLIVPYGIETVALLIGRTDVLLLLIVPYGIETAYIISQKVNNVLLIVPYGIETRGSRPLHPAYPGF